MKIDKLIQLLNEKMSKKDIKRMEELEYEYGSVETWEEAVSMEDFDFFAAFEAGHFYANNPDDEQIIKTIRSKIKTHSQFDKAFEDTWEDYYSYNDREEFEEYVKKDVKPSEGYFVNSFPDGTFKYSMFAIQTINLDKVLRNLKMNKPAKLPKTTKPKVDID